MEKPITQFIRALRESGASAETIETAVDSFETLVGEVIRKPLGRPPGSTNVAQHYMAIRHPRRGRPPGSKNKKKKVAAA